MQAERLGDDSRDQIRLTQRDKVRQPDTVLKHFIDHVSDLDCQPGLSTSPCASEGDQARHSQRAFYFYQIHARAR